MFVSRVWPVWCWPGGFAIWSICHDIRRLSNSEASDFDSQLRCRSWGGAVLMNRNLKRNKTGFAKMGVLHDQNIVYSIETIMVLMVLVIPPFRNPQIFLPSLSRKKVPWDWTWLNDGPQARKARQLEQRDLEAGAGGWRDNLYGSIWNFYMGLWWNIWHHSAKGNLKAVMTPWNQVRLLASSKQPLGKIMPLMEMQLHILHLAREAQKEKERKKQLRARHTGKMVCNLGRNDFILSTGWCNTATPIKITFFVSPSWPKACSPGDSCKGTAGADKMHRVSKCKTQQGPHESAAPGWAQTQTILWYPMISEDIKTSCERVTTGVAESLTCTGVSNRCPRSQDVCRQGWKKTKVRRILVENWTTTPMLSRGFWLQCDSKSRSFFLKNKIWWLLDVTHWTSANVSRQESYACALPRRSCWWSS